MSALAAIAGCLALPILAGLIGLCWPETRKVLLDAARYDARRIRGRLRHPLTRQSANRFSTEHPWDGWAP